MIDVALRSLATGLHLHTGSAIGAPSQLARYNLGCRYCAVGYKNRKTQNLVENQGVFGFCQERLGRNGPFGSLHVPPFNCLIVYSLVCFLFVDTAELLVKFRLHCTRTRRSTVRKMNNRTRGILSRLGASPGSNTLD